jgi:hypothetical protein
MLKIAPFPVQQHDILAVPLYDQPVGERGLTVLVVLVAVAFALARALRAAVGATVALLRPALILFRLLVFVVGLVLVVGWGLVTGEDRTEPGAGRPEQTQPAPEPAGRLLPPGAGR